MTDSDGYYEISEITLGDYTVTPLKTGWKFLPASKSYQQLSSDKTDQDFSTDYTVTITTYVWKNDTSSLVIVPETGEIKIEIPANTFPGDVVFTVSTITVPASGQPGINPTKICLEMANDLGYQPDKKITITISYVESDIQNLVEAKLAIARYDETHHIWILLPSSVNADKNSVTGTTDHLSKFALVQLVAATDLKNVRAYPVPYRPKKHPGGLTIENLTPTAKIKIYTVSGDFVREIDYSSQTGRSTWDGKNDSGNDAASGIYIMVVKRSNEKKILKVALER